MDYKEYKKSMLFEVRSEVRKMQLWNLSKKVRASFLFGVYYEWPESIKNLFESLGMVPLFI
jgi:hypothetical protein